MTGIRSKWHQHAFWLNHEKQRVHGLVCEKVRLWSPIFEVGPISFEGLRTRLGLRLGRQTYWGDNVYAS
jgi:hypothetical protein